MIFTNTIGSIALCIVDCMSSSSISNDTIELACRGLEGAVKKYLTKYHKQQTPTNKRQIQHCVQHACHILQVLSTQRKSLEYAIQTLKQDCWRDCQRALHDFKLANLSHVLTHILYQYLRIRDGFVLLSSGECRHSGDANNKNNDFPSRFSSLAERNDGYTKLYKSELGYTGASWDEFFDENVGVRHILIQSLQKYSGRKGAWDTLLDYGAQLFETELDNHETLLKQSHEKLEAWRKMFERDLQSLMEKYSHGGKIKLVIQDKMEHLEVTLHEPVNGVSHVVLQRRANEFQVADKSGVLPKGWKQLEWKESMQLQQESNIVKKRTAGVTKATKRRRIINEESSDTELGRMTTPSAGLKVRMEMKKATISTENETLNDIKCSFGVNASELETAREAVENEERGAVVEASSGQTSVVENAEEKAELEEDILLGRALLPRYRRILHQAIENDDDFEIWDAREVLRQTMMSVGSNIISLTSMYTSKDTNEKLTLLTEARALFRDARDIVEELEASQKNVMNAANEESVMIRRRLLLLRGRALTNHGISLLELAESGHSIPKNKLVSEAIGELQSSQACAKGIRESVGIEKSSALESYEDTLQADLLDGLTGKWLGKAFWNSGHRDAAVDTFLSASKLFNRDSMEHRELIDDQLLLKIDCYFCCVTLVDLVAQALEKLPLTRTDSIKWTETTRKGDELLNFALKAYDHAVPIIGSMKAYCGLKFDSVMQEHSIASLCEIESLLQELKGWWEAQKDSKALSVKSKWSSIPSDALFVKGVEKSKDVPRQRFIVSDGTQRKSMKKRYERAVDSSKIDYSPFREKKRPIAAKSTHKWGDALLPQIKSASGEMIPLISYPSIAPPLPPEMRGLIINHH